MADDRRYCAYLLRGWLETSSDDGLEEWRFRLRDVQTGEEKAFTTVEAIAAFLEQTLSGDSEERA